MRQGLLLRPVRRATVICWVGAAVLGGVGLAYWTPYTEWYGVLELGCLALCLGLRRQVWLLLFCLSMIGFLTGWWRGSAVHHQFREQSKWYHQAVTIEGVATDEALYGQHSQLEVVLTRVRLVSPVERPVLGNVTASGFGVRMIYRGDMVRVQGKLYPSRGNSLGRISFGQIEVAQHDMSRLNELRRRFAAGMQSALPEPAASFALGLLIGQRSNLPDETSEQLRRVGLTHVIAVSGYNLTVLVLLCRRLLARFSKYQATLACALLLLGFLLCTGTSPPVVRAAIVSTLSIAAWYYGREIKPLVLLFVGAVVTVLANPLQLWGNVSWYLSFLSFYGVLLLAPLITKRFWDTKEPKLLGGLVVETVCATVVVLPYALYIFGQLSLVSLPANIAVVPLIPIAMLLSFVAGLAGWLCPVLAGWLAWPAHFLLVYMLDVAAWLSRLPMAFMEDIVFSLVALVFSYGLVVGVSWLLWRRTHQATERPARVEKATVQN